MKRPAFVGLFCVCSLSSKRIVTLAQRISNRDKGDVVRNFRKMGKLNKSGMIGLPIASLLAVVCSGQSLAQRAPPVDLAAVEAGPYSPEFFTNPPMLQADGTEQPADENSEKLTWSTIPTAFELYEPVSFQLPTGETHWYQAVYLPEGGVNWIQAQDLAEQKGGYLVSLHSQQENDFAFSLVADEKYWRKFPYGELEDGSPFFNLSGAYLGGYQVDGAEEPGGGWAWVSGEPMTWTNWLQEGLDIGVHIPSDNQPNNSARGAQNVLAFGEVDEPASYWCDVSHLMGTYGSGRLQSHGFIIEYNSEPE